MTAAMGSFVADQVISKSVEEMGQLGDKATVLLPNQRQTKDVSCEDKQIQKHKKRLKEQHRKREAQRRTLRHQIRSKYGIKENERHKARINRGYDVEKSAEKSQLVEREEDDTQCCCCFCLSYLFGKQEDD